MAASTGQIVCDMTIATIAETSTGSGIWKVHADPTTGASPRNINANAANGFDLYFDGVALTGLDLTNVIQAGDRIIVGIDKLT